MTIQRIILVLILSFIPIDFALAQLILEPADNPDLNLDSNNPSMIESDEPVIESNPTIIESTPPTVESNTPAINSTPLEVESSTTVIDVTAPVIESKPPVINSPPQIIDLYSPNIESKPPLINANPTPAIDLVSPATQVDYSSLAELLQQGKWRKANDETRDLLLEAADRKLTGWLATNDIQKLACWDLLTVDKLWKNYSNNKFGFSVQLPIYIKTGNRPGKLIADNTYSEFGDRVGWRKDDDWIIFIENLDYSLDAPKGHLPNMRSEYSITGERLQYTSLAERMIKCNLIQEEK